MRNLNRLLTFVLIVGLVLTTAYFISAQQGGSRRQPSDQQSRRQFDPEAMIKRRVDRIVQQLNLSEEETAVLKPNIEGILQTRVQQSTEMRTLMSDLRNAINAKDDAQIKAKLDAVKAKQKEHKAQAENLEKELVELLTVTQEAQLTISGIVNSDGSGFFGGFGGQRQQRPGGQGSRGARGGARGNQ